MGSNKVLDLRSVTYEINKNTLNKNISLDIKKGDMVSIVGPNGAGKSTLLKLISGELKPSDGTIIFKNKDLRLWNQNNLACNRAFLSQSNHLSFSFNVIDIVKMGRYPYKKNEDNKRSKEICSTILNILDLEDYLYRNYITLSGGEKQRVQLARVLAQIWSNQSYYDGKVLILDEPTSFLDVRHQCMMFEILSELNKKGLTIILVLHDLNSAINHSKKIIFLKKGKLIKYCHKKEVNSCLLSDVFDVDFTIEKNEENESCYFNYKPGNL